ncbi:MAG: DUF5110 domain-containing protein [Bacteroidales bacterium]|nr:DUF5110 domain-containing protein [Bacteroidales bacterium]
MKTILWLSIFFFFATSSFGRSLYKIEGNNVIVDLDGIGMKSRLLKVEVLSDKAIKIVSGMETTFSTFPDYIFTTPVIPQKFKVGYAQNNIEITTRDLLISVQEDGLVRIFNREGNKLLIESDRFFEAKNSGDAKYKIKQRFFLNVHEDIYGFGFGEEAPRYNIRGKSFEMKKSLSSIASPVIYSEKGYAIVWNNYSHSFFNDQKSGMEVSSDFANEIQYYFFYGPSWDEIIAQMRLLTGKAPMLPRWAFGHWPYPAFHQSASSMQDKAQQFNSRGIPAESVSTSDYNLFDEEKSYSNVGVKESMASMPAYPSMRSKYEQLNKTVYDRRPVIPTLINYPGIQSFGTFLLAGKISPSWDELKVQICAAMNLPLSGQPYWATFIGGASESCSDFELLTRWYQFAAFTPIFLQPKPDRDMFNASEPKHINAISEAIKLRYRMLPYIYSTAAEVSYSNKTITRSLMFDYGADAKVHNLEQQYMFGDAFMVCPVTEPNASQITVYFPQGNQWYDYYSGKVYEGGTSQKINVVIDRIPLFVKGGSIIPLSPVGMNATDSLQAAIEVRVYPGQNGNFNLYEDNNDGPGYQNGQSSKIPFVYTEKDKSISIGSTEGSFNGMLPERTFKLVMVTDSTGTDANAGKGLNEIVYKGKKLKVKFQ